MKNLKLKIPDEWKNKLSGIKNIKMLLILGFAGILLIFLSELISPDKNKKHEEKNKTTISKYEAYMESQLEEILKKIEGVGKVNVLITFEGTEEYIYAYENKENISENGESKSSQTENKYIFVQKEGNKEALVKKVINPCVSGVLVVCEGGGISSVKEKVYNAVSVSLGIPINRIYVDTLKK